MPVNVLTNSTLSSSVSSRVASSGFLAKVVISNYDKMQDEVMITSRCDYGLSSNNGYLLYLQNNNKMDMLGESLNIIYDVDGLLTHLDEFLEKERSDLDFDLGEFRTTKEELEEKITTKEEELNEEEDESTLTKLHNELEELKSDFVSMIEEDEKKCELISSHDSLIDDVYTVRYGFKRALHDAITSGRYTGNGEYYIFIRSDNINTSLTNIFDECAIYESDIFEEFEVVDIEFESEENIEEPSEEHTGEENEDVDEDGFQRLPTTNDEDATNNNDDDPSSDDESDDPSTEEEIKDTNEEKEFTTKNGFSYCNGCKASKCSCFNENKIEDDDNYELELLRNHNYTLLKHIERKDEEIEKLKALLKIYIK
jgi:hypothetical protein